MSQQNQAPGNNPSQNRPAGSGGNPPPRAVDMGSGAAGVLTAPAPAFDNRLAPVPAPPRESVWVNFYYLAEGEEDVEPGEAGYEFDRQGNRVPIRAKKPWSDLRVRGEEVYINDDGTATFACGYPQNIPECPAGVGIAGHFNRPPRQLN